MIFSSEWDSIPFYIPSPPAALLEFVIIGIPAFASRNSLLLPLAAHELSHAVWREKKLDSLLINAADKAFRAKIDANPRKFERDFSLNDNLFLQDRKERIVSDCLKLVSSQCQEMFCDLLGASIFKESYVYAFDAFLAPGFGTREPSYPSFSNRAKYIIRAALTNPSDLRDGVLDLDTGIPQIAVDTIVRYADDLTSELEPIVLAQAKKFASLLPYENKEGENTETMMRNLRNRIPPNNPRSPVDILNAIWRVYFERRDQLDKDEDRSKLLLLMNNLCLKSLEIYEYRHWNKHARIAANN